jgi:hypothetical protein
MTIFMSAPPDMPPFPVVREWFLVRDTAKMMPMMNGLPGHTPGEIRYGILDSQRVVFTTEDYDYRLEDGNGKPLESNSAIPTGRYLLTLCAHSNGIQLNDVPGFSGAEICELFNKEKLPGGIAVGAQRTLDGVRDCQPAIVGLVKELRRLKRANIACYLNVTRAE